MGVNTNFLLSLVLILAIPLMVNAVAWNVGGAAGWSRQAAQFQFNYPLWANNRLFLLNDTLSFFYDPNTSNVLEVSLDDYRLCNSKSPLAIYTAGNDSIPLTEPGHRYFISGNSVDCHNCLKVDIQVYNMSRDFYYKHAHNRKRPIPISYIIPSMITSSTMYPLAIYTAANDSRN
ncbi:hypothetical protein MKW92_043568 [Papaver armeniacum]|nr:hypothetical protein MKW92_043568 [Papaver armeniacum]